MHRVVKGLKWARALPSKPKCIPASRPKGVKALGVRYEKALAKAAGGVSGQWFEFEDSAGLGFCQTDVLVDLGDAILVLEAKLSWVPAGHTQINQLYRPVVDAAFGKPVIGVVVVKYLTPEAPRATGSYVEAIELAKAGGCPVLHWIGGCALRPSLRAGS